MWQVIDSRRGVFFRRRYFSKVIPADWLRDVFNLLKEILEKSGLLWCALRRIKLRSALVVAAERRAQPAVHTEKILSALFQSLPSAAMSLIRNGAVWQRSHLLLSVRHFSDQRKYHTVPRFLGS